jgi:hypothetical protein
MRSFNIRTLLAALCLSAFAASAFADDTPAQRLGRFRAEDDNIVIRPQPKDDATETEKVRHRGYFGPSYYAYRPYYGYSYGFTTSYYAPRYYAPQVYYYTPRYYYAPPVYYTPSYYYHSGFCGISGTVGSSVTLNLNLRPNAGADATPHQTSPTMPPAGAPGTFRYDGDPARPIPMPEGNPMPRGEEPPPILAPRPTEDSLKISLQRGAAPSAQPLRFKAYGEKGTRLGVTPSEVSGFSRLAVFLRKLQIVLPNLTPETNDLSSHFRLSKT